MHDTFDSSNPAIEQSLDVICFDVFYCFYVKRTWLRVTEQEEIISCKLSYMHRLAKQSLLALVYPT